MNNPSIENSSQNPSTTMKTVMKAENILEKILFQEDFADVFFIFEHEDSPSIRIAAHKAILTTRSEVFAAHFSGRFSDDKECKIEDVSHQGFKEFIRFLYTDSFEITDHSLFIEMFYLAEKYMIKELLRFTGKEIIRLGSDCILLEMITHPLFPSLLPDVKEFILKHIDSYASGFFRTKAIYKMTKEIWNLLLKRDSFGCTESIIYRALIIWGRGECKRKGLPEEMANIREEIGELRHLIRFPVMSIESFNQGPVADGFLNKNEAYDILLAIRSSNNQSERSIIQGEAIFYNSNPRLSQRSKEGLELNDSKRPRLHQDHLY